MIYIKICKHCGNKNPAASIRCGCGQSVELVDAVLESDAPEAEEKEPRYYRLCAACNHRNFVAGEDDYISGCANCGEDVINRPLQTEGGQKVEEVEPDHEVQPDDEPGLWLTELISRFRFNVSDSGGVIGAEGNLQREFFKKYQYVSGKHIEIIRRENSWYVKDLGSMNKTRLNGDELTPALEYELSSGDILKLADVVLNVSIN